MFTTGSETFYEVRNQIRVSKAIVQSKTGDSIHVRSSSNEHCEHELSQLSELTGTHALKVGTWSFASPKDLPIPIQLASSCGISLHIETPTFCPHIADRLSS